MPNSSTIQAASDIFIEIPGLLKTFLSDGEQVLLYVYRSALVSVTGFLYKPVTDFLATCVYSLLWEEELKDETMQGGIGIQSMYQIGGDQEFRKHVA